MIGVILAGAACWGVMGAVFIWCRRVEKSQPELAATQNEAKP